MHIHGDNVENVGNKLMVYTQCSCSADIGLNWRVFHSELLSQFNIVTFHMFSSKMQGEIMLPPSPPEQVA